MPYIWNENDSDPDPDLDSEQDIENMSTDFTKLMKIVTDPETNDNINKFKEFVSGCTKEYLDRKGIEGTTAIHVFCKNSRNMDLTILQTLIDAGANINLQNKEGLTALMCASEYSNTTSTEDTVKMLIDANADLNLQNILGFSALMIASIDSGENSTENTVRMLIDARANLNLQDIYGRTALMMAVDNSDLNSTENTVKILIDAKANLDLRNDDEQTALMIASRENSCNAVNMIIDATENINSIEYFREMDLDYFFDSGYSLYHPSFSNMHLFYYTYNVEPRKKKLIIRNTILERKLPKYAERIRFNPKSKAAKLLSLKFVWSKISEDDMIKTLKEECIWDFLSIRDKEDMHQKISDYLGL